MKIHLFNKHLFHKYLICWVSYKIHKYEKVNKRFRDFLLVGKFFIFHFPLICNILRSSLLLDVFILVYFYFILTTKILSTSHFVCLSIQDFCCASSLTIIMLDRIFYLSNFRFVAYEYTRFSHCT